MEPAKICTAIIQTPRATYYLDAAGYIIARTNGPRGWNYCNGWRILGFAKRWHSRHFVTLAAALAGEDIGHAYVCDLDHGIMRMWGTERATDVRHAMDMDRETAARLQRPAC